jgi:DNA repair exonuclease SbcCD ATPase subunit
MDEKLSTKMIKYDYDRKIDREEYEANLVREVENLEEQLEMQKIRLGELDRVLQESEKLRQDLQDLKDKYSADIKEYETRILALTTENNNQQERVRELQKRIEQMEKLGVKCLDCDSYGMTCKCNDTLGYAYCTKQNGYKGYRKVIKEME